MFCVYDIAFYVVLNIMMHISKVYQLHCLPNCV